MKKIKQWLVNNCRDSDIFAYSFMIIVIILMIIIAFM